jgi:hypothetical protein
VRNGRLEGTEGILRDDPHGERVHHLHAVDHAEEREPLVVGHRVEDAGEVEAHGLGVERRAVVEGYARPQMERPGHAVGLDVPALGQPRHDGHGVVEADERLVDHHDHLVGLGVGRVVGVEGGCVGRSREDQLVAKGRGHLRRVAAAADGDGRNEDRDDGQAMPCGIAHH